MKNILLIGGTGKTGRRIARRLEACGHPVRTASRTGAGTPFDLDDPSTWAPALADVTAAYLVEPNLRSDVDREARIPRLVGEAVGAGVRRLVLLSAYGVGEADDSHPLKVAEHAVRGSGADWTILRPDWFSQNFSEGPWLQGIRTGTLSLPTGDGRTPFVDAEDIAEVAASALTEDRHSGRTYQLTGPRAIGFGEAAGLIGRATGRTVRHVDVDPDEFTERQLSLGVPSDVARLLTGLLVAVRSGRGAVVGDGVERALGRPPRSFEDYVTETAAAGHWT
ncbi:NmrA family transcriptional regulator [Streptomyces fodineus]|uniref:NmrA family transcriptional regulator n=1 Tax=Streptomyces fodineus TaxID=1904616 RepID=A0A1D7YLK9_9ACTN|nr:NAD(P)H-binding protein [Streptomyces fodineus]AOR36483.1 NmrA family transcriptional regulator [Streptomyces fodineus]